MPGIADLLWGLSGQPDPGRQMAALLQGPNPLGQGGPPQGPGQGGAGPAQQGPPPGPGGPAPAVAPGSPPPPGSPPQPNAVQSPPDLAGSYQQLANPPNIMQLYLQMQQQNAAKDQFNRGLALIAANYSGSPQAAHEIMSSVASSPDAGTTVNNLMSLYGAQQQMQARQQELASAPDIAAKLGVPVAYVQSEIMAGRGAELLRTLAPTDEQRNIQWEHDQFIKGGGSEEDWQKNYLPQIITRNLAGGNDPMFQAYLQERRQALAQDPNAAFPAYPDWTAQRTAKANQQLQQTQAQSKARDNLPAYDSALTTMRGTAAEIVVPGDKPGTWQINPENKADLEHIAQVAKLPIFSQIIDKVDQPGAAANIAQALPSGFGLSPSQIELIRKLKGLSGTDLHQLTAADPNRAQDLLPISRGLEGLSRFDLGTDKLVKNVGSFIDALDTARANGHGAAGNLANMPDDIRLKMDPSYGFGGSNFLGPGLAMTPADVADAQDDLKKGESKADVIRFWRSKGKNTKPIE